MCIRPMRNGGRCGPPGRIRHACQLSTPAGSPAGVLRRIGAGWGYFSQPAWTADRDDGGPALTSARIDRQWWQRLSADEFPAFIRSNVITGHNGITVSWRRHEPVLGRAAAAPAGGGTAGGGRGSGAEVGTLIRIRAARAGLVTAGVRGHGHSQAPAAEARCPTASACRAPSSPGAAVAPGHHHGRPLLPCPDLARTLPGPGPAESRI